MDQFCSIYLLCCTHKNLCFCSPPETFFASKNIKNVDTSELAKYTDMHLFKKLMKESF